MFHNILKTLLDTQLDTYSEKIAAVSLEQVQNAFQGIKPDKMIIIMLGKK